MIAIVVASQQYPEIHGLDEHLPLSLFPLVDRPLLHHIVEYLVGLGIRRFEFILSHLPEKVEACLGDGARWGSSFHFHLIPKGASPYRMVRTIAVGLTDTVLLASADCLPEMLIPPDPSSVMFFLTSQTWSGWAVLPPNLSAQTDALNADTEEKVSELLLRDSTKLVVAQAINFRSGPEVLLSQQLLMLGKFSGLLIGGRQSEKGIWISRNVSIHPTVTLEAPVYVGPNCRIGRSARLGPCAVISENCILDSLSSVENSVVAPGTYIGQGLELNQVLIDRNLLVNVKIGTSFLASETFLLSSLVGSTKHKPIQQLVSRLGALLLLLTFFPVAVFVFLYMTIFRTGGLYFERAISIPADDNPSSWRQYSIPRFRNHNPVRSSRWSAFLLQVWPGLLSVLKGDLSLVGVQPRSPSAITQLSKDWRSIYLKSRAGLITEAYVMFGDQATEDEIYTAEAYYSATETILHDLKITCLYLRNLILDPSVPKTGLARDS